MKSLLLFVSCQIWIGTVALGFSFSSGIGVHNTALVVASPGSGRNALKGVTYDYDRMKALLQDPAFALDVEGLWDPSQATVERVLTQAAKEAGAKGTVVLYFSGHGSSDGEFAVGGKLLSIDEILSAVHEGRQAYSKRQEEDYVPLKRMVVIADSCFSGQLTGAGKNAAWRKLSAMKPLPVEQMVILAATRSDESAIDDGKTATKTVRGGRYTVSLATVLMLLVGDGDGGNITFDQLQRTTVISMREVSRIREHYLSTLLGKDHTPTADFNPSKLEKSNVFPKNLAEKKALTIREYHRFVRLQNLHQRMAQEESWGRKPTQPMELDEIVDYQNLLERGRKYGVEK